MGKNNLTLKETSLFFFPLLLNVQLMSVSHSVINAGLARQTDYITALAGFSVAMVLHLFLASPSYQNHTVTIAMARGRKSLRSITIFVLLVASYVSIMLALVAFTPFGTFLLGQILGVSGDIANEARAALGILVFLPFATGLRGLAQGLVIQARRTGLVSVATGIRVGGLVLFLLLGQIWFSGARLGAFALLACVTLETLVVSFFAWRIYEMPEGDTERTTGEILRYAFPLAYSSCLQQTIPLLINAIISRLPDAPLALAAFGVIRGFLFLLSGPMRNLQQAYLTLVREAEDNKIIKQFFLRLASGMALIMVLIALPLNDLVLGRVMGLAPDMCLYITWPLIACAGYPFLYGMTNLLRGVFAGAHRTGMLGRSTIAKTCYMLCIWVISSFFTIPVSGIDLAILLLISAEGVEFFYLRHQQRQLHLSGHLAAIPKSA
jgi:hypothetical protein